MRSRRMQFEVCLEDFTLGEEDAIRGVPEKINAPQGGCNSRDSWTKERLARGMQFEACLERVKKTCQRLIFIFLMLDLRCDFSNGRCAVLEGFFMAPILDG